MDPQDAQPLESRTPTATDLLNLCRHPNEQGAKYMIVGGFAVIQHGFTRATEDIDLLIEGSPDNQKRVRAALESLPDKAVRELGDSDLNDYLVVRVCDEIVVDLMLRACGIDFAEAEAGLEFHEIDGVKIPFASVPLLLRMKETYRSKDELDRAFLKARLRAKS
jgi:hypothetical protein